MNWHIVVRKVGRELNDHLASHNDNYSHRGGDPLIKKHKQTKEIQSTLINHFNLRTKRTKHQGSWLNTCLHRVVINVQPSSSLPWAVDRRNDRHRIITSQRLNLNARSSVGHCFAQLFIHHAVIHPHCSFTTQILNLSARPHLEKFEWHYL